MGMYQVDGKQYGIPYDLGMVGIWYNKDLFQQAGITRSARDLGRPPGGRRQAQGQRASRRSRVGGTATWTEMFWWAYLALRECGTETMLKATITTGDWTDPCFVEAGKKVKELVDKQPFQEGFLAAKWDGAGGSAATMAVEKSGDAAAGPVGARARCRRTPPTRRRSPGTSAGSRSRPWPAARAKPTDGFGGGNGFAVGKDAPPEAIEFLKYISEKPQADRWGALNTGILPVTVGLRVLRDRSAADVGARCPGQGNFVQLYLDQATIAGARRTSINDAVATLFAGTGHA